MTTFKDKVVHCFLYADSLKEVSEAGSSTEYEL